MPKAIQIRDNTTCTPPSLRRERKYRYDKVTNNIYYIIIYIYKVTNQVDGSIAGVVSERGTLIFYAAQYTTKPKIIVPYL